jgi:hypothetical protein
VQPATSAGAESKDAVVLVVSLAYYLIRARGVSGVDPANIAVPCPGLPPAGYGRPSALSGLIAAHERVCQLTKFT